MLTKTTYKDLSAGEEYAGDYIENDDNDDNDDDDNDGDGDDYDSAKSARVMETDDDASEVTDYDYDANFGVVLNENELAPPDFEDPAAPKAPPSYDYSHFDVYNAVRIF